MRELMLTGDAFLRPSEVARRLGYKRPEEVDKLAARDPTFPRWRTLPTGSRGILQSELDAWLRELPEAPETETARKARKAAA